MLWRCAAYNPHSAWQHNRKEEIAAAFSGYHVLGLSGTKFRRGASDPACCMSRHGTFRLYEWGHSGKAEHAAGVALYLRDKVFAECNIKQVFDIPTQFQGRLGILRVKRGDCDFCFIVAYPWVQARTVKEQQRVGQLWAYIGSIVARLPYRCVPVIFTDANAKNSLCKSEHGLQRIESPAIGPCTPELENSSGTLFRSLLEQQFLCSVNSFMGAGHTYFGNVAGVKSRIDHVCLPQSLLTHVLSCGVLYSVGARLQRVFGPGKRDHIPVNVVFRHASAFSGDAVEPVCKWDKSLLVDGVLRGDHRRELVSKIVARCKDSGINKFADDCDLYPPTPAVLWQQMREVVWDSAYSLYRKKPARQQPRPADTQAAIDAHVEACYVVANLPQSAVARPEREHSHQFLAEILHQWRAALKFYNTRSARDKLLKRDAKTCLADRVVEFNYAHRRGDGAQVWRLGRCLSGFKVGPKRRRYDAVSGGHPGAGEWVSFMGRKGEDGGCSGWEVDWDTRQQSELSTQLEPVRTLAEAKQLAKSDLQRVCRLLRIHKLRKAVPAWGVPGEVWRQLVSPNEYYVRRRHGLGFDGTLDTSVVGKCLLALFVSIRLYDVAPLQWHLSQTFQIDKHNNKPACEGLRTINTFEPLGKAFIKTLWDRGQRQSDREWASGYIAHKSRVTPIMQRRIIKHRLRQAGESHCDSFYDAANAFPSVARSVCDDVIDNTCRLADRRLLKQRNNEAILLIHASDRKVFIQSGSGSLQGDSHAGAQFLEQYHPAVDTWLTSLAEHEGAEFYIQDPVNQQFVDASVSTYADDVARTSLCQSATELSVKLNTANSLLSAALRPIGIAQNVGKQVHVPCFVRQGADTYTRAVFCEDLLPGNTCRMAKYLGVLHHAIGNDSPEILQRIRSADIGWFSMGKFWFRQGLFRTALVLVFKGLVYSPLLSGLEALCINKSHLAQLDKYVIKRGRQLMHGAACEKTSADDGIKYKAVSNVEVWRFLQSVPTHIELRVRRLKFWQNVAMHRELHTVLLACLFGDFDWEQTSSLDMEGKPTRQANPWLQQFAQDIDELAVLDSAAYMVSLLRGRVLLLFTEFREDFLRIDVSELRARFLGREIPPPGWVEPPGDPADIILLPDDDAAVFTCDRKCSDGSVCNKQFSTYRQLRLHMVHTKDGEHGSSRLVQDLAAVSNVCPWCRNRYASRESAKKHIKEAFNRGYCLGKGSAFNPAVYAPKSMACPLCGETCDSLDALLHHVSQHDSPAAFQARQALPAQGDA